MAETLYTGRGSGGVPKGGKLEQDIQELSDPVKRKRLTTQAAAQNLQTTYNGQPSQPGQMVTGPELDMNRLLMQQGSPAEQIQVLGQRVAQMRTMLRGAEPQLAANLTQLISMYMQRITLLQSQMMAEPTTQLAPQNAAKPQGGSQTMNTEVGPSGSVE